jgi:hypothetical protein
VCWRAGTFGGLLVSSQQVSEWVGWLVVGGEWLAGWLSRPLVHGTPFPRLPKGQNQIKLRARIHSEYSSIASRNCTQPRITSTARPPTRPHPTLTHSLSLGSNAKWSTLRTGTAVFLNTSSQESHNLEIDRERSIWRTRAGTQVREGEKGTHEIICFHPFKTVC